MPDQPKSEDLGAVWRGQPQENTTVKPEPPATRRTRELYSSTRTEILMSIGAAVFLAAMMAWRFGSARGPLPQVGVAAVGIWVVISLWWFRDLIVRKAPPRDALAAASLEYYRKELERRRDHLRNAWIWHGPLLLACIIFVAMVAGTPFPGSVRNVLPLFLLLAVWTGFDVRRRRRQAKELQRELDELGNG